MSDEDPPGETGSADDPTAETPQLPAPPVVEAIPGPAPRQALNPPPGATPPELLQLGGEEAFEAYRQVFDNIYRTTKVIFDPQGRVIIFEEDACRHVCFREERFDKRRKTHAGEEKVREEWDQARAEHIRWIWVALTAPSLIVHNNQVEGNLAYLLGYPRGNTNRPSRRYYVSVRPTSRDGKRAIFKTAYPISQEQWDRALRGRPGRPHILYRGPGPRW